MKNKEEQIKGIDDVGTLGTIVKTILQKSDVSTVTVNLPFIDAVTDLRGIGEQRILFYLIPEYLGRNYLRFKEFEEALRRKMKGGSYSAIVIVSSKNITGGFQDKARTTFKNFKFDYWDTSVLLTKIETAYLEYWKHSDQELLAYEKKYEDSLNDDWSIKKIKQFKSAHEKLLKIFVEPRLLHKVNDLESPRKAFVKISIDKTRELNQLVILEGEPGIGKTRLLKQIGYQFTKSNDDDNPVRYLPLFINNVNLIESKKNGIVDIRSAIEKKVQQNFGNYNLTEVLERYALVLLIDSIDEFDKENQAQICSDLKMLCNEHTRIFLGTRHQDFNVINGINEVGKFEEIYVEKFNDSQIRAFLSMYFKNDVLKADDLLNSLKENHIIQRLPITPLNLSLISILYEENNFEIPATITDIYDNFNNLLLGRSMPESKFDFFDINIRERVLSVYALELLKRGERSYMTMDEFISYFEEFFKPISGSINFDLLPEALDFLINNTGILVLQDNKYVRFMHDSYMEYYASREIFFYQREEMEKVLVNRFLELTWQYTAIFYGGRTKQMEDFLSSIIKRTRTARKIDEFYKSIFGLGYLIQALYMTKDELRKDAILSSLEYTIEIFEWMKKSSADDKYFFKKLSLPITAVINTMLFFEYHNSITVREPLNLAFNELAEKLEIKDNSGNVLIDSSVAFKMFTIALTLSSPRLGDIEKIKYLIYNTSILNDPFFEKLLDFGLSVAGSKELYNIKDEFKKPKAKLKGQLQVFNYNQSAAEQFVNSPAGRFRFTPYDRITPDRKFKILTEGKTDAQIVEHAYCVLTGEVPYWEILPISDDEGGGKRASKVSGKWR